MIDSPKNSKRLEENLVRFAAMLRCLGLRIGTAELMNALNSLRYVDILDREQVKAALMATLVKATEGRQIFETAFNLFFAPPDRRQALLAARNEKRRQRDELLEKAGKDLQFQGRPLNVPDEYKEIYASLNREEQERIITFLSRSSSGVKVDVSFQPIIENIVMGHLGRYAREAKQRRIAMIEETGDEELDAVLEETLCNLELCSLPIMLVGIETISERDMPKVALLIKRLAHKLATQASRRYKLSVKRARLDIRRTIRSNVQYGGVTFKLKFRKHEIRKPRLLLICDLSGSMLRYSSFVFQFVYGLSSVVDGIEFFGFSERLERLTGKLQRYKKFEEAVDSLLRTSTQWGRGTNMNLALAQLLRKYPALITPRTVVIIVSDTKTLYVQEAAQRLREISGKVRGVVWLNPVPKRDWKSLPAVEHFKQHCVMVECNTLQQLDSAMRRHLLRAW